MKFVTAVVVIVALAVPAGAAVISKTVEYRHGDAVLEGYLAYDDAAAGKRPAVLVVHEWWGLNDYVKARARQIAELGYVAFAIDMYGRGRVTTDPKTAGEWAAPFRKDRAFGRARAHAGLEALLAQGSADPSRVAAIGYCFGGTTVLEMARGGEALAGVVSFHGGLDTPSPAAPGAVRAKVLVLAGGSDPFVPPAQVNAFADEMTRAGADWQIVVYGGAQHSFTNPAADSLGMKGVGYDRNADRRSLEAMKVFFSEILK